MGRSDQAIFNAVARTQAPQATESDGDLLERYTGAADEVAFAEIVRRHGPMVFAVCRRRLGHAAEVDDAFQATFLALALAAYSLNRNGSLAGWLCRVAYLAALKTARWRARHSSGVALPANVPGRAQPPAACEVEELKTLIDAELATLPEKFRDVVVLCLVEGRTNAEAAGILGVPIGTIDSRLSTARKKLQTRLTRRGVAVGVILSLEQGLSTPLGAADAVAVQKLIAITVRAVLAEATGHGAGALSPTVTNLARGVKAMMSSKLRFTGALCLALGVAGIGAGVYLAAAAGPPAAAVGVKAARIPLEPASRAATLETPLNPESVRSTPDTAAPTQPASAANGKSSVELDALQEQVLLADPNLNDIPLFELLQMLSKRHKVSFVIADMAFEAVLVDDIREKKPNVTVTQVNMTLDQFLRVVLGSMNAVHLVKNGRIEIVPIEAAAKATGAVVREGNRTIELVHPLVSIDIVDVPLRDAVARVAKQYDLTVVVSPHVVESKQALRPVLARLLNVPADRALELLAMQHDLQVVRNGPAFLLTTRENATEVYKAQLEQERHEAAIGKLR